MANSDRNVLLKAWVEYSRGSGRRTCFHAVVLILATCLALSPIKSLAVGCPNSPDHWFNVTVTIDAESLPAGVTAESAGEYYGTGIYLTNSTNIPLVINPPAYLKDSTTIPLPDPKKTYQGAYPRPLILKLVSGEGYYCDGQYPMRCDMNTELNKENAQLDTPAISKAMNSGWVARDDRLQGVKIPPPQSFQFFALYGDRQIPLHGKVSFSLNNKYNPKLGAETKQMCEALTASGQAQAAHDEWYKCQSDAQCVIVAGNCGVEWAVNKDLAEQTRKNPPRADMPCHKPLESHPANTVATCENGKCVLSPPGFYAGGTPISENASFHNISREPMDITEWRTLTNRHGWSVRYPPSWQAAAVEADSAEEEFQPILTGPGKCLEEGRECGFVQLGSGWGSLDARQAALSAKDALLETISPRDSRYVLMQQGDTTLDGQPAYFIIYRMKLYENYPNGVIFKKIETKYQSRFYFIVFNEEGKNRAAISAIDAPDGWELNPTFEAIVSSFKFTAK